MSDQRIEPEKIASPFQLLAATLVFVVLLDSAFLSAAAVIEHPVWAASALVASAIVFVPFLLIGAFVLQTRFRGQLLADDHYVSWWTTSLKQTNDAARVELTAVVAGAGLSNLEPDERERMTRAARRLERALVVSDDHDISDEARASASIELARTAMAREEWLEASLHFRIYLDVRPDDWAAHFALATAYANSRGGVATDELALRALGRAIERRPSDVDRQIAVRMHSYRAGILKRLHRLDDAERELLSVITEVEGGTYESDDVNYNLACVYAMTERPDECVAALQRIDDVRFIMSAAAHQIDYFVAITDFPPFRALIDRAMTSVDRPPGSDPRHVIPPM